MRRGRRERRDPRPPPPPPRRRHPLPRPATTAPRVDDVLALALAGGIRTVRRTRPPARRERTGEGIRRAGVRLVARALDFALPNSAASAFRAAGGAEAQAAPPTAPAASRLVQRPRPRKYLTFFFPLAARAPPLARPRRATRTGPTAAAANDAVAADARRVLYAAASHSPRRLKRRRNRGYSQGFARRRLGGGQGREEDPRPSCGGRPRAPRFRRARCQAAGSAAGEALTSPRAHCSARRARRFGARVGGDEFRERPPAASWRRHRKRRCARPQLVHPSTPRAAARLRGDGDGLERGVVRAPTTPATRGDARTSPRRARRRCGKAPRVAGTCEARARQKRRRRMPPRRTPKPCAM